jgi:cellulose synthase/poly-beta-1,6-N-acetylglucosamine synthase-like glycosyltransferase
MDAYSLVLTGLMLASGFMVFYAVLGYGLLVVLVSRLKAARTSRANPADASVECGSEALPSVVVMVSARNEELVIRQRIDNIFTQNYPAELLRVVVISDGSSDGTVSEIKKISADNDRLRLIVNEIGKGKNQSLNDAVKGIDAAIVVFTDANTIFEVNAIRHLVLELHNHPQAGCVGGVELHGAAAKTGSAFSRTDDLYFGWENTIKLAESELGLFMSGNGSILAVRRDLFKTLHSGFPNDFQTPLDVILQGFKPRMTRSAIAFENSAQNSSEEFARKRRIVARASACYLHYFSALSSWQKAAIASHKLLRWTLGFWIVILFCSNLLLVTSGKTFLIVGMMQLLFWLEALVVKIIRPAALRKLPFFAAPYYFAVVIFAAAQGLWMTLRGEKLEQWNSAQSTRNNA